MEQQQDQQQPLQEQMWEEYFAEMELIENATSSPSSSLYTYEQERMLFWAGKPTTVLGILGSTYICYCVLHDATRRNHVFRRFLCCVSAGHILLCLLMALSTIPTPAGTLYASYGSPQTCQAIGFLTHVAFGFTLFYHAAMGFYYIFTFFLGWSERQFQDRIEPILHSTAVLWSLTGAIVGICTNMYGPNKLLMQCWVETGADHRTVFVLLSGLIELNYFTIFKQLSLVGIAVSVYKQERKMILRYSVANSSTAAPQALLVARETLMQASCFFLSCFIPYAVMMIMRYYDLFWKNIPANGKVPSYLFGLAMAAQVFYPLQGPVTMIGFLRPDFRKRRKEMPDETCWQSLWATMRYQLGWAALKEPRRSCRDDNGADSTANTNSSNRGPGMKEHDRHSTMTSTTSSSSGPEKALTNKQSSATQDASLHEDPSEETQQSPVVPEQHVQTQAVVVQAEEDATTATTKEDVSGSEGPVIVPIYSSLVAREMDVDSDFEDIVEV